MRYFKFLKTPQFIQDKKKNESSVATVITITSDLGDKFYNADLECLAIVEQAGKGGRRVVQKLQWKAGMRALKVYVPFIFTQGPSKEAMITLTTSRASSSSSSSSTSKPKSISDSATDLLTTSTPSIVSAISAPFHSTGTKPEPFARRNLLLRQDTPLDIWENSGTSIEHLARHIWDAGVCFSVYLGQMMEGNQRGGDWAPASKRQKRTSDIEKSAPFEILFDTLKSAKKKHLLELGCGCGVSGLSIAKLFPDWKVRLTDLPEAEELCHKNISSNSLSKNTEFSVLDWLAPFPDELPVPSIVLISDCTYNPDTAAPLVQTLVSIAEKNPEVLVFLAYKKRHDDEKLFFELVEEKFEVERRDGKILTADDGFEDEELEFLTYRLKK